MKTTPSRILRVVALVGLGIAAVLTFRATAQTPTRKDDPDVDKFVLTMPKKQGEYHFLKKNDADGEKEFINLLHSGPYEKDRKLHFKHNDGVECDLPDGCPPSPKSSSSTQLNIKTDKVTVANAAQSVADGDPHVTIKVASKSPAAIKAVVDLLAEP